MHPRAGLVTEARGKILSALPGIELRSPGHPARSLFIDEGFKYGDSDNNNVMLEHTLNYSV
jgi:hypothetical protein